MTIQIQLPGVCERDVDLLLLEEFVASPTFCAHFLSQTLGATAGRLVDARRSVVTGNGESDLELVFESGEEALKVLIENKVDAPFMANQPERYAERANQYRDSGEYCEVATVIIAPMAYFGDEANAFGFDAYITYEAIAAWFKESDASPRCQYKLAILDQAISRSRSGWTAVPNSEVSAFWQSYWQLTTQIAPQLNMPVPK
ncbi:MAG: PD-(D/E)XK nuclease family protein, partial [Burkholderiaceae bacterium]